MGMFLFIAPPAVFPGPGMGLLVMRSMKLGGGFNVLISPNHADISQNYFEFLTRLSPGQYLLPYFLKIVTNLNMGQGIAILITICQLTGLAGFYVFFKKIGFTPFVSAISLVFIVCQQAFVVPYVFYNGGEILLFAFEGWFLYGCVSLEKTNLKLVLFVILSGWLGFFFKSSFIWIYAAGLCCLWIRLCVNLTGALGWIKKGLWIVIPAVISLGCIYIFYISKGLHSISGLHSTSSPNGIKLTLQSLGFPLASPVLSGFSVDDLLHGLIYNTDTPVFNSLWSIIILVLFAILSLLLILNILRNTPNKNYRVFIIVFYSAAIIIFGIAWRSQVPISYEARHFRIIGLLIVPGVIYMVSKFKPAYQWFFAFIAMGIGFTGFNYLIAGYKYNKNESARGISGIAQPNIDQHSLDQVMKLDRENKNAIFVFVSNDVGLTITHNRVITLKPIGSDLKINMDDYVYKGYAGPLYIVLPETYAGPKEKMIMKSFPGYTGFNLSMLSDNYVLYAAKMKRQ
jgi:hypothetical protein